MTISTETPLLAETPPVAGPGLIGALAGIAKGTYTQIVSITAPASAVAGDLVSVVARVKNLADYAIYIAATGHYDGRDFAFKPAYANVGAGVTTSFTFSFVMLAKNVRVDAWSYYWTGSAWVQDDQAYVNVAVEIPLAGTIIRKELEYAGDMFDIPARDVPIDVRALVHIWGRNDTSENQKLGLSWNIRAPDGKIVEEGYDWESWHTGPGGQHHFIIPPGALDYLNLSKEGKYTIGIGLSMNPAAPTLVDSYSGSLCTVVAPAPPVFEGTIVKKQLEYAGKMVDIPAADVPLDMKALAHIWGRNDTSENQKLGLSWEVKDPAGKIVEQDSDWESWHTGPGGQHHFIIPPGALDYLNLSKEGKYTLSAELLMNPASPVVVDSYNGTLCTVAAPAPPVFEGTIIKKELEYDGKQVAIPVADIPVGLHGLIHIWGRNDMATNQKLGLSWVVRDPDGSVIEQDSDWESWHTGPGGQHHFIIPPGALDYVDFDKVGTYTMRIELMMNPDSPVVVESYDGDLGTVTTEVPPEYDLIQHTIYPHAYFYDGTAEVAIADFTLPPEEFPWTEALGKKIADSMASKLEEEAPGSRPLELKLYCDKAGPLWSKWRIEVSASVPSEGVGAIGWVIPWPLVIKGAFIIAALVLVYFIVKAVTSVFVKHKPLSEEVKKQWSKETLIGTITDLRPEYSPESLEGMSEQELRDILNQVYEEEAPPPGVPWWKWALLGGLGIAGGAVTISAIRLLKPKR